MHNNILRAAVTLVNNKVRFSGISRKNDAVMMDYFPPVGDGEGYTGLELLLMSLSGCSGTAISILLQKMNKNVEGLIIHASGVRNEIAPFAFRRIELTFQLISRDALEDDLLKAIHITETSMCPVWAMLKGNVEIVYSHSITRRE